jgi:hypothetical protein
VEEYFGDFKYIILFNNDSEIPPPDPMRKTHLIGFYGDRVLCVFPFQAKRRNFRLPAVGFWSLAFPFFACAGCRHALEGEMIPEIRCAATKV